MGEAASVRAGETHVLLSSPADGRLPAIAGGLHHDAVLGGEDGCVMCGAHRDGGVMDGVVDEEGREGGRKPKLLKKNFANAKTPGCRHALRYAFSWLEATLGPGSVL